MRYAIISDLHANLQAFEAVLADIGKREYDTVVCLGDIIGYGPQPAETLLRCQQECHNFILGNHDAVAAGFLDPSIFNEDAQRSAHWTVSKLGQGARDFFKQVPLTLETDGLFLSHATLSNPAGFGYLDTAEDTVPEFLARPEPAIFVGHTHHSKAFQLDEANATIAELPPADFQITPGYRYIINPGSVGDPRSPEPLARYASYDSDTGLVRFFALDFDIDAYRAAWQASRSPYQQYFHRVLDEDIPTSADESRVAPPPTLMSSGLQKHAAAGGNTAVVGGPTEPPSLTASQKLVAASIPVAAGAQPVRSQVADGSGGGPAPTLSQKLDAAALEQKGGFPWMIVFLLLLFAAAGGLVYLKYFTNFSGFGMTPEIQRQTEQNRTFEEMHERAKMKAPDAKE